MTNEELLRRARQYFEVHGYLPYDIGIKLIERGYDAQGLERSWTQGRHEDAS